MPSSQPFDLASIDTSEVRITSSGDTRAPSRNPRIVNPGDPGSFSHSDFLSRQPVGKPTHANSALAELGGTVRDDLQGQPEEFAPRRVQSNWTPPNHRRETRPDPTGPARMRSELVIAYANPPRAVLDAYSTAREAIDAYDAAVRAILDIAVDQAEEEALNKALVQDAITSGAGMPELKRTDWHAEGIAREVRHEMAWKAASKATAHFQAVVRQNLDEWRLATIKNLEADREKALKLLTPFLTSVRRWHANLEAAEQLSLKAGTFGPGYHQSGDPKLWRSRNSAVRSLAEIERVLNSEDPVITGRYLKDDDTDALVPPLHTRQNYARAAQAGADWAVQILGQIESEEGYKKTQFTPMEERHRFNGMGGRLRAALSQRRLSPQDA